MSAVASVATARLDRGSALLAAILGMAAVVVAIFHTSYAAIWQLWTLSTYQYAFVVVPAAAYVLWLRRQILAAQPVAPSWPAVALLLLIALLWQIGRATAVQAVEHAAVVLALPALVLAVLGRRAFRAAAFSMLLLATVIPVGEAFTPGLMVVTAEIAGGLLHVFGIAFARQGQYFTLAGGNFEVADICSGVHYLLAGLTVALLFSYWNFRTLRKRALFVAATVVACIIGNGIRAFIVMTVASATQMRYFSGSDHVVFGMVFFVLLLGAMFLIASRYADAAESPAAASAVGAVAATHYRSAAIALAVSVVALSSGPLVESYRMHAADATDVHLRLPLLAGCDAPTQWRADWTPRIHGAAAQQLGSYRCDAADVHILMVAYLSQTNGGELVGSSNLLVPDEWWRSGTQGTAEIALGDGHTQAVKQTLQTSGSRSMLAWHWYAVNGRPAVSGVGVKLREALATLTLRPVESRAYVVAVVGPAGTAARLRERATQAVAALDDGSGS